MKSKLVKTFLGSMLILCLLFGSHGGQITLAQQTKQTNKQNIMPALWRSDLAPDYFWNEMELIVTQGYVPDMLDTWTLKYGKNQSNWPLEYQAIWYLWDVTEVIPDYSGGVMRGLPDKDDITQDEAIAIAWQQYLKDAQGMYDEALIKSLKPRITFYFNYYEEGNHIWTILFGTDEDKDYGVVEVNAKTGEIIGHAAGPGQG